MPIPAPTPDQLRALARELHFELDDEEANFFAAVVAGMVSDVGELDDVEEHNPLRVERPALDLDLLLLPTTPTLPGRMPAPDAPLAQRIVAAGNMTANTAPFDVSGHPAPSFPCGREGALPIGAMLVGRHFDDGTLLRAAHGLEIG